MVTHIYKNFLLDENQYKQCIDFWKTIIYTLLSVENIRFSEYLASSKATGELYLDGNPIYNFRINNSNRAVRIIQEEIETEELEFSAWINQLNINNETITELVISLELSHESTLLAIELINAWILNEFSEEKMERFINKIFTLKNTIFPIENQNLEANIA
ncbi:MAG TPA: hypothetical protein DCQ31_18745 [Bacteroidales bacterium]|nr:hypothetical protein [Bacteroidales bacterium]